MYNVVFKSKLTLDDVIVAVKSTKQAAFEEIASRARRFNMPISSYEIVQQSLKKMFPEPSNESFSTQAHYAQLNPEPIVVIEKWNLDYLVGNAIKYIARAGKKVSGNANPTDAAIADYTKAVNYLNRKISSLQGTPSWSAPARV